MTISEFCFKENNHFLCLQRSALISKVYLVFITRGYIIGLVVDKGLWLSKSNLLANSKFVGHNILISNTKPYDYIKDTQWYNIKNKYIFDQSILCADEGNFRIELAEITAFEYTINDDVNDKSPIYGSLFLSTKLTDLNTNKAKRQIYSYRNVRPNSNLFNKELYVMKNQAINFDATFTAVRNWLLRQNVSC